MRDNRPVIGITPWFDEEKGMSFVKRGYYEAIMKAGGLPVIIPLTKNEDLLSEYLKYCDGILLSGGTDVDAKHYGEYNMPHNQEISPIRDEMEIYIVRNAICLNKPLFGICRGIQVMNAAMGGTLYQDIHSQINDREVLKHSQNAPKWYPTHDVQVEKGSKVWEAFKRDRVRVNSFHHQAVKDVAPNFTVTCRADDGVIEAIEYKGQTFAVGVQWHPELMWQEDSSFLILFKNFIESSSTRA